MLVAQPPAPESPKLKKTILVIDQERSFHELMRDFAETAGHQTVAATTIEELNEILRTTSPDLIFIPSTLPIYTDTRERVLIDTSVLARRLNIKIDSPTLPVSTDTRGEGFIDTFALARWLKQFFPNTPLIFCTAHSQKTIEENVDLRHIREQIKLAKKEDLFNDYIFEKLPKTLQATISNFPSPEETNK